MLTLELSSHLLEIHTDAHMTLIFYLAVPYPVRSKVSELVDTGK